LKNVVKDAIQVCTKINDENFNSEYNRLISEIQNPSLKEVRIITSESK